MDTQPLMYSISKWLGPAKLTIRTSTDILSQTICQCGKNCSYVHATAWLAKSSISRLWRWSSPRQIEQQSLWRRSTFATLPLNKLVWSQQHTSSLQSPPSQRRRLSSARLVIMLLIVRVGRGGGTWGRDGYWKAISLTNGLQSYQLRLSEA